MLLIFLLCFIATSASSQPVASNIIVDDYNHSGGHSSFRVTFNTNVPADNILVQWGPTSAYGKIATTYAGSSGGTVQQWIVSGLEATTDMNSSRQVYLCVEAHNTSGWSSCYPPTGGFVTIPAVPS